MFGAQLADKFLKAGGVIADFFKIPAFNHDPDQRLGSRFTNQQPPEPSSFSSVKRTASVKRGSSITAFALPWSSRTLTRTWGRVR